ncbi:hypothetical protein L345_16296, partial [Ophiophagus hannah]
MKAQQEGRKMEGEKGRKEGRWMGREEGRMEGREGGSKEGSLQNVYSPCFITTLGSTFNMMGCFITTNPLSSISKGIFPIDQKKGR